MSTRTIQIATRRSPLAIWQAGYVRDLLCDVYGDLICTLVPLQTRGDERIEQPLSEVGGKGLFLKELEVALLNQEADIAVHSMKDVPATQPRGLRLHSIGPRGPVRDVWISDTDYFSLTEYTRIGTSSSRRKALFKHCFKRGQFVEIRGNVQTRLKKLSDGEVDALILAEAGLARLEMQGRVRSKLPLDVFVPAAGQGVIAVEYAEERNEISELLMPLVDNEVESAVQAERRVVELLGGDCTLPFGSYCDVAEGKFSLTAVALSTEGDHAIYAKTRNVDWRVAAETVASRLEKQGATRLLGSA